MAVPVSQVVGLALISLTALLVWGLTRRYPGAEQPYALWALVATSLLASPIAWHNYLLLLAPGILLLAVTGHGPLAFLLVALQMIPPQWPQLFEGAGAAQTATALTLYTYILLGHWLAFLQRSRPQIPLTGTGRGALGDRGTARPVNEDGPGG